MQIVYEGDLGISESHASYRNKRESHRQTPNCEFLVSIPAA
jgi:hypothetical protein